MRQVCGRRTFCQAIASVRASLAASPAASPRPKASLQTGVKSQSLLRSMCVISHTSSRLKGDGS